MCSIKQLERIAKSADKLELFLKEYAGTNADWPVEICCDEDVVDEMVDLLNNVQNALKPYRKRKSSIQIKVNG